MSDPSRAGNDAAARSRETRILAALWLAVLLGSTVLFSAWIGSSKPENLRYVWFEALALATVPGKFAVFGGLAAGSPLDPWGLALLGTLVDTFFAISLSIGLAPFMRLPGLGAWLRRAHERARVALSEYPRLRRMAFFGAAFFVALPLPGSGWMGGTFAGQLLGLSRLAGVGAIALGTAFVSATFAGMAVFVGERAKNMLASPWIYAGGILALLSIVWILWRRFRVGLRRT